MIIKKYPKIKNVGDRLLTHLFDDEVEITEKVDDSQFRIYYNIDGAFEVGSKNQEGLELFKSRITMTKSHSKNDMFDIAVEQAERLKPELETYLNELKADDITLYIAYLRKPKHNALKYDRVPKNNFYLFAAVFSKENEMYNIDTSTLLNMAYHLNIEPVNILWEGKIDNQTNLICLLDNESVLGGTKIEGIVIKNYQKSYPVDLLSTERYVGFPLAGKLVRDEYKEIQRDEWNKQKKASNIDGIAETYLTEQRFLKCLQHLNEEGKIINEKKDLAVLIPEFLSDLKSEEEENINLIILSKFWEDFRRRISNYVVKEYNEYLLNLQFCDK